MTKRTSDKQSRSKHYQNQRYLKELEKRTGIEVINTPSEAPLNQKEYQETQRKLHQAYAELKTKEYRLKYTSPHHLLTKKETEKLINEIKDIGKLK